MLLLAWNKKISSPQFSGWQRHCTWLLPVPTFFKQSWRQAGTHLFCQSVCNFLCCAAHKVFWSHLVDYCIVKCPGTIRFSSFYRKLKGRQSFTQELFYAEDSATVLNSSSALQLLCNAFLEINITISLSGIVVHYQRSSLPPQTKVSSTQL